MVADPAANYGLWRNVLAALLVFSGAAMFAWSFGGRQSSASSVAWTQEQAIALQEASIRLHSLSHQHASAMRKGNEASVEAELDRARSDYVALQRQLDAAIARPAYIVLLMRVGGVLVAIVGGVLFFSGSGRGS